MQIRLASFGEVSMRQILHNSGVPVAKCFRLAKVQFVRSDSSLVATYRVYFEDATVVTVDVYFDNISLQIKAGILDGSL